MEEKIYQKDINFISRSVGDENILVPHKTTIAGIESIYVLNYSAHRAWDLIDGRRRVKEIIELISSEFDAPKNTIKIDLLDLFTQLENLKIIKDA